MVNLNFNKYNSNCPSENNLIFPSASNTGRTCKNFPLLAYSPRELNYFCMTHSLLQLENQLKRQDLCPSVYIVHCESFLTNSTMLY